ncbi:FAD-binding domain [Microbacterium sp. LWH11-1.2]|uniref:FAD-binding domain n=1 Tax=Microbacterium sp. LWH11-1.2 TaxID=3135258 RepID=UPI0031396D79
MKILIVGAGVAGPTVAHWLLSGNHEVTIVERASAPREGGYLIDFWGAGFEVAERMGIVPRLSEVGYAVRELREVDDRGQTIARMDPRRAAKSASGRFLSVARSDLAAIILSGLEGRVETLFGDTVTTIEDRGDRVVVQFAISPARDFDLVIGADGLHSSVRRQVFGSESDFERYLGIMVAVFVLDGYEPRDELVGVTRTTVGRQVLRFAQRDGSTVVALTFRHEAASPLGDLTAQQDLLRDYFADMRWEVPEILDRMPDARSFYFDRVSQIRMPDWSRGRVVLLGDAAACASLLAGQGSALAMIEGYVLAQALNDPDNDHTAALIEYEHALSSFVRSKQDAAARMGAAFAPRNRFELALRNGAIRSMRVPWLADIAIGRSLHDRVDLPEASGRPS